jgi:hypothetical protein
MVNKNKETIIGILIVIICSIITFMLIHNCNYILKECPDNTDIIDDDICIDQDGNTFLAFEVEKKIDLTYSITISAIMGIVFGSIIYISYLFFKYWK